MTSHLNIRLIQAVRSGNLNQVKLFLAQGAKIDATDPNGTSSLMYAAGRGDSESVKILLEAGASVNQPKQPHGV
ncbi:MAG: ankyrin repeat domain-containing protein, partial [Hydrococcus sp. Prado102]|nr:ankyrin repeat domain-containing protein [Hydrococcus sp. Prado102]